MSPRQYTICFKRDGKHHWLSRMSMDLKSARIHWQSMLLAGSCAGYTMALEPAPANWTVDIARRDQFMADCRAAMSPLPKATQP